METIFWSVAAALASVVTLRGRAFRLAPYLVAGFLLWLSVSLIVTAPASVTHPQTFSWAWSNTFGAALDFRLDGLSRVLVILIGFIGSGVFCYSASYMRPVPGLQGFYTTLTLFTAAMIGLVLADNLIAFFLFWESTSVCSFLLVGTNHQSASTRESARKALFLTVGGGLMLLIGFLMISAHGQSTGLSLSDSLRFSMIGRSIVDSPSFPVIVFCMAVGIATKSAQVPFHIWLPAAMAGPTPVSSFLHSATMVKAGVFLLARLTPSLGGNELWNTSFTIMGSITMVTGAILASAQRDIKKILAYSTIAVLGTLVMLLGIGTDIAIKAAIVYLVAHALYKASLFQIVGNIDYATGSRDIKTLGSLARMLPLTATAAVLSALSKAGAPPLFGFFGKELAYLAKIQLGTVGILLLFMAFLTNVLLVGLALSICYRPFWSKNTITGELNAVPLPMSLVPLVLSVAGLFIGLFPAFFDQYLGTQMASAIAGQDLTMKLKLWHGINFESLVVIALSAATLAIGVLAAVKVKPIISFTSAKLSSVQHCGPNNIYERVISGIPRWASSIVSKLQNGNLKHYITWTLAGTLALLSLPLFHTVDGIRPTLRLDWIEAALFVAISLPVIAALIVSNEFSKLILLGASGFGVVLAFAAFAAPDLALTQLLVEALVLVFVLALFRVVPGVEEKRPGRSTPTAIALGLSLAFGALLLANVPELPNASKIYFLEHSYLEAFGKNVVNVILVDFRALDTFGEAVVVAIAALGCGSLLLANERTS
ncbi:MAG: DUF4040 domain-containing protein [Bdellovibrionaceae bacterium]|nr:DUF4040 domain-containing protein [Bdellovibrionales bacterium]MCB9255054.1 DUF4040 domain-containing protein [Pseudobdellovibrionaceae bacterium]